MDSLALLLAPPKPHVHDVCLVQSPKCAGMNALLMFFTCR
jgi:hypothetical protein